MATPKKRTSRGRQGRRRAHDFLDAPQVVECSVSGLPKLPHRICEESGYYGKRKKVFDVKERL
ncbi:MAG: 50S ribosomal protein L32 [Planctomycetes bacterium]|nr:50S ribosomal protein L32 [Planctomycetota bacterium]NUQ35320.1 50S ribosomal protein L32 [Planctomycetaceae bacterium]